MEPALEGVRSSKSFLSSQPATYAVVYVAGMIAQVNFVSNYRFTTCKVCSFRSSRIESAIGFEPMNISFAERPLKPLGYADILRQSPSISLIVKEESMSIKTKSPGHNCPGLPVINILVTLYHNILVRAGAYLLLTASLLMAFIY